MFFYNIIIRLYYLLIWISSIWNPKARAWMQGRKNIDEDLRRYDGQGKKSIWFHCASLGEFEQGRPLMELYKKHHPELNIVISFFSPSGYQIQKKYKHADLVTYLPRDYPNRINQFINRVDPKLMVIVKYEYWLNLFKELDKRKVPRVLISARFVNGKYPINTIGKVTTQVLRGMKHISAQDEMSAQILEDLDFDNVMVCGDTRVDRVMQIAMEKNNSPKLLENFCKAHKILICGSTWNEDEMLLDKFVKQLPDNWRIIIAPHEIDDDHITKLRNIFPKAHLMSHQDEIIGKVLIIDSIGILSKVYGLGDLAYVGGAFRTGLHNILEPAGFGLPVIFGPKFHKFNEAIDLVKMGGAFSIKSLEELWAIFNDLDQSSSYKKASNSTLKYMQQQKGSTQKIYDVLEASIFSVR